MEPARRDSGSIVLGWLTKLIVSIAVVGVVLFDAISIGAARLGASDDANAAAEAAAQDYLSSHNVDSAYRAALTSLPSSSETIPPKTFLIASDGGVTLVVRRTPTTLVTQRVGPLKKYTVVIEHGDAPPATP
jgi:hypothetical protein